MLGEITQWVQQERGSSSIKLQEAKKKNVIEVWYERALVARLPVKEKGKGIESNYVNHSDIL